MGSKPADQGTMKTASAGAQASDQALADQAKQNTLFANSARTTQLEPERALAAMEMYQAGHSAVSLTLQS
jgi:hypothetical protein